ncbi:MAG: hypothetical protein QFB86_01400 [Patescibacteria group bacterium]|nr:hypothetical protein [Patescibacteria group bacterium]
MLRNNKWLVSLFAVFIIIYVAQSLLHEPPHATLEKFHITATQFKLLLLTIVVPYILIWIVGLFGYLHLKSYVEIIRGSKDGEAFNSISKGVLGFVLWLPLSALAAAFAEQYYTAHPESTASLIRAVNYFNLLVLIPAFYLAYRGSVKLTALVKGKTQALPLSISMAYIAFSALYVMLVLDDPAINGPTNTATVGTYYQPDWLIITTIVIPRLLMWLLGVRAARYIYEYSKRVKGMLYRDALKHLAQGLSGILLSVIVLRVYQSLSSQVGRLSLGALLVVIYILLLVISIGFIYIAKGAKNLRKLEGA